MHDWPNRPRTATRSRARARTAHPEGTDSHAGGRDQRHCNRPQNRCSEWQTVLAVHVPPRTLSCVPLHMALRRYAATRAVVHIVAYAHGLRTCMRDRHEPRDIPLHEPLHTWLCMARVRAHGAPQLLDTSCRSRHIGHVIWRSSGIADGAPTA